MSDNQGRPEPTDPPARQPKLVRHGTHGDPQARSGKQAPRSGDGGATQPAAGAKSTGGASGAGASGGGASGGGASGGGASGGGASGGRSAPPRTAAEFARDKPASGGRPTGDHATRPLGAAVPSAVDGVRRARLKISHVEPWTVAKVTFALSIALGIVGVVAVSFLWLVLSFAGVWDQINSAVTTMLSDSSGTFDITDYLGFSRLVGFTLVISAINTVVMTAVAVIGSHLYNLAAQLLGGVDITVSEDD